MIFETLLAIIGTMAATGSLFLGWRADGRAKHESQVQAISRSLNIGPVSMRNEYDRLFSFIGARFETGDGKSLSLHLNLIISNDLVC
jgi:hypothetical protein